LAQARKKNPNAAPLTHHVSRGVREGALILLSALAVYLLVSLFSYHYNDPGWSHTGPYVEVRNVGGGPAPGSRMCSCT
jgi:DNA segregation ATPase FtsK/SpoIIIE, S-DNA-T family